MVPRRGELYGTLEEKLYGASMGKTLWYLGGGLCGASMGELYGTLKGKLYGETLWYLGGKLYVVSIGKLYGISEGKLYGTAILDLRGSLWGPCGVLGVSMGPYGFWGGFCGSLWVLLTPISPPPSCGRTRRARRG